MGNFDIRVRIHPEVNANISLVVESDSDIADIIVEDPIDAESAEDQEESDEGLIAEGDEDSIEESETSSEENE